MRKETISKRAARAACIVLTVGVILGLTGCTPRHDVSFGYIDGELLFVACTPMEAEQVHVRVRHGDDNWEVLWIAEGEVKAGRADEIAVLTPDPNLTLIEHHPERWEGATRVSVELFPITGLGELGDPVGANVAASAIPRSTWLRADGHVSESPCNE